MVWNEQMREMNAIRVTNSDDTTGKANGMNILLFKTS